MQDVEVYHLAGEMTSLCQIVNEKLAFSLGSILAECFC